LLFLFAGLAVGVFADGGYDIVCVFSGHFLISGWFLLFLISGRQQVMSDSVGLSANVE
jgi:hypothetical protein